MRFDILGVVLAVITPVISFFFGRLTKKLDKVEREKEELQKKEKARTEEELIERKAMKEALKSILKSTLKQDHEYYLEQGYCSTSDKEEVDMIYNCYHNLGGNGLGTSMYKDIIKLPDSPRCD